MSALHADLALAIALGRSAGALVRARWETGVAVHHKGDVDLVTEADLAAERHILTVLGAERPDDAVLAEEGGATGGQGGRTWYVDPLDGTTNFAHGFPHFCVSLALADAEGLAVGVVHAPIYGWTFAARRGGGATFDGAPMRVSTAPDLDRALLATGFPYDRRTNPDNNVDRFGHLLRRCQGIRRAGSAALDLAFVARGWLDGYWESRLKPWDLAAGCLLVAEAGGQLSDLGGGPLAFLSGEVVASNGRFHVELCRALAEGHRQES